MTLNTICCMYKLHFVLWLKNKATNAAVILLICSVLLCFKIKGANNSEGYSRCMKIFFGRKQNRFWISTCLLLRVFLWIWAFEMHLKDANLIKQRPRERRFRTFTQRLPVNHSCSDFITREAGSFPGHLMVSLSSFSKTAKTPPRSSSRRGKKRRFWIRVSGLQVWRQMTVLMTNRAFWWSLKHFMPFVTKRQKQVFFSSVSRCRVASQIESEKKMDGSAVAISGYSAVRFSLVLEVHLLPAGSKPSLSD